MTIPVALLGVAALGVLAARQSAAQPAARGDEVDEITVTARKLAERIEDVPLAIDVVLDDGAESGVDSLQNLIARTPGLYYESLWGGLGSAPTLRGQQPTPAGDVNVGVFVDGVYQANQTALDAAPIDVARIEVVRGPQSALLGHSTFAGAIHYVGRAPTARPETGFTVDVGSGGYEGVSGVVSGPLGERGVLGRAAIGWRSFDGQYDNAAVPGAMLGGWERRSAALSLEVPRDYFSATLSVRASDARSAQPAAAALTYLDYNCGAIEAASGAWSYYCGQLPVASTLAASAGVPRSNATTSQVALQMVWQGDAGGSLTSLTTVYRGRSDAYRDFDLSATGQMFGVCTAGVNCSGPAGIPRYVDRFVRVEEVLLQKDDLAEWSQEVRWRSGGSERQRWSIGAVVWDTEDRDEATAGFQRGDLASSERLTAILPLTPLVVGPVWTGNSALVDDPNLHQVTRGLDVDTRQTAALFGTYDRRLSATVEGRIELRVTHERRRLDNRVAEFAPGFGLAIPAQTFTDVTPRLSVSWAPTESLGLYVSAAKGSQSGGINSVPGLLPEEQLYEPEYNWTYEIGVRYARERFGIDGTVYDIDWRDAQVSGFAVTPGVLNLITLNTAGISTQGIEIALRAEPRTGWRTELALSYADPRYRTGSDDIGSRRFCGLSGGNTTSTLCAIGPARASGVGLVPYIDGNVAARTPRRMWHAGVEYSRPFSAGGRLSLRLDANGQDDVYERAINGARFGERTLVDARLAYEIGPWSIALWGRNLGDEEYVRAASSRGQVYFPTTPRPLDMLLGDPRRAGLTLSYAGPSRTRQ